MKHFVVSNRDGVVELIAEDFQGSSDVASADLDHMMYREFARVCYDARREEIGRVPLAAALAKRDIATLASKLPDLSDENCALLREHLQNYEGHAPIEAYNIMAQILDAPIICKALPAGEPTDAEYVQSLAEITRTSYSDH